MCFLDQYSMIKYDFLFIISNIDHLILKLQPIRKRKLAWNLYKDYATFQAPVCSQGAAAHMCQILE